MSICTWRASAYDFWSELLQISRFDYVMNDDLDATFRIDINL